jgi:hypothetical protein
MRIKSYYEGTIDERERILEGINRIEEQSHQTRTPLFQETLFELVKEVVENMTPPRRFRDIGNAE